MPLPPVHVHNEDNIIIVFNNISNETVAAVECHFNWRDLRHVELLDNNSTTAADTAAIYRTGEVLQVRCIGAARFRDGLTHKTLRCTSNGDWTEQIDDCSGKNSTVRRADCMICHLNVKLWT